MGKKARQDRAKQLEDAWEEAKSETHTKKAISFGFWAVSKVRETVKSQEWTGHVVEELRHNKPLLIFLESIAYYLYLSYFPPLLALLVKQLGIFRSRENLEFFVMMFSVTWLWGSVFAYGNDVHPEMPIIRYVSGRIDLGETLQRSVASIAAGLVVAAITQNVFRQKLFFATWKHQEQGWPLCFAVEFGFTLVTCSAAAFVMLIKEQFENLRLLRIELKKAKAGSLSPLSTRELEAPVARVPIRGVAELATFVVVAAIFFGMPYTNGGPCLNSIYSIIAAVHHRSFSMGLCHMLANWVAAAVAGHFICLKSVPSGDGVANPPKVAAFPATPSAPNAQKNRRQKAKKGD